MPSERGTVVILGTGGTIAGTAASANSHVGYTAAALGVDELLAAIPALLGQPLATETIARLDSCDMDHATWALLARRAAWHLAQPEVTGVVVTHGTDTLEETAYFLHLTVAAAKPLVLTAAMRPATALSPDGPQNLFDAVLLARDAQARGVLAMLGGRVIAAVDLRKLHGYRVDAFSAGDAGDTALLEDGRLRVLRSWPTGGLHPVAARLPEAAVWPAVDIVTSHAGARSAVVDALVAAGARGLIIAGTGNGSLHAELLAAAHRALAQGVLVRRASRCILGGVVDPMPPEPGGLPSAGALTPAQARVELMLDLMSAGAGKPAD